MVWGPLLRVLAKAMTYCLLAGNHADVLEQGRVGVPPVLVEKVL